MTIKYIHNGEETHHYLLGIIESLAAGFKMEVEIYDINTSKFINKRTGRSLLSRYAASSPFVLLCDGEVDKAAIYKEEVADISKYSDIILKKILQINNDSKSN